MKQSAIIFAIIVAAITFPGCFNFNTSNQPCKTSADCNHEMTCIEGICVATYMMGDGGGGSGISISDITPANPYVTVGKTKQFSATVSGATDLTVDWSASCGTINATGLFTAPASASQCEIKATSHADPNAFKKTTAKVVAAPQITSFTAAKSPVSNGKGTTLTAVYENGSGSIDNGIGPVTSGTPIPTGNLSVTMTYKLTVTNQAGDFETSEVTIQVIAAPSITSFTASPDKLTKGNKTNLTAVFENGTGEVDHGIGAVTSNTAVLSPAINEDTTFKLTVTNAAGDSVTKDAFVQAVDGPVAISLTADPNPAFYGGKSQLTAVFTGGTGTIDNGIGTVTSGTPVDTGNLTVATKYKLTVSNTLGQSDTKDVTVNIQDVVVSDVSPASPYVTVGLQKQFNATVTGAADPTITWTATAGTIDASGLFTAPQNVLAVTITAKSAAKQTVFKQTTVNVVAAPAITSFSASPNPALYDGTTKLTAVFTGGNGVVDNGIGQVTTGVAVDTPKLKSPATYKLTVTNQAGENTSQDVTITIQDVSVGDISPASPSVTVVHTKQFSATVTGAFDASIDWTSTCGSISPTGLFTAPSTTQSCEITATSHAYPSKFKKTGVTIVEEPHITSFVAANTLITSGKSTTLKGMFENGTGSVDNGVGAITSGTSKSISPASTTTYTLTVTNVAGDYVTSTATVSVVPLPIIGHFVSDVPSITQGESTSLLLSFIDGTGSVDQGIGSVTSGVPVYITPSQTTTYTLTVTNSAGDSVSAQTTVTVYPVPVITSFTASPNPAYYGGTTELTAVFTGGTGTIDNGIGTVTSGTGKTSPAMILPTQYTLTVTNGAGKLVQQSVNVTVQNVVVSAVTPSNPYVTKGQTKQFYATVTGAANTTILWSASDGQIDTSGLFTAPNSTGQVTITAQAEAKPTVFKSTTPNVVAMPEISSFTANPNPILYGATSTLTGSFTNGTGSVDHGIGTVTTDVGKATPALTADTTYTLTVTNLAGTQVTRPVTVNVQTVSISDITPANIYLTEGDSQQFSATVTNAVDSSIDWSPATDTGCGAVNSSGVYTAPLVEKSCIITATSHADPTKYKTTGINVVAAPHITSFAASPNPALYGGKTTLTGVFENGTGSVDHGIGSIDSGVGKETPSLTTQTTYKLTVTNLANKTTTASVTVNIQTVSISDITPANPTVLVGTTQQFTATVSGAYDTSITWTASAGSMNPTTGLWTAPATPLSPPGTPVTITATANADGQPSSQTTALVVWGPAPTVTSITPNNGDNTGTINITNLAGTGFVAGATVKLVKTGMDDVPCNNVVVVNASRITCTFDLTDMAGGALDVLVTNTDGQSGTLTDGFTVNGIKSWRSVGSAGFSDGQADFPYLFIYSGVPYLAFQDYANSQMATVMKFNGTAWELVGNAGFSEGRADFLSIYVYNGVPYVAYSVYWNGQKATVMKFNGLAWEIVGNAGFSAGTMGRNSLYVYNGVPYLAFGDGANDGKATVMKFDGTSWVTVGNAGFSISSSSYFSLSIYNDVPYVTFRDNGIGQKATVMKLNGTTWETVGNAGFSAGQADYTSLYIYNGVPYVAYVDYGNGQKATVMKLNGTTWETVGNAGFSTGQANYTSLSVYNGMPYVAFREGSDKATVMKFNGTSWQHVGDEGFSAGRGNNTSLFIYNGVPYVAYKDNANYDKATVMQFTRDYPAPTVSSVSPASGNNNGTVSVMITETGWRSGAGIALRKGMDTVWGTNIASVDATHISCTFDLTGKDPGAWDVVIANDDAKQGVKTGGFTVNETRTWQNVGNAGFTTNEVDTVSFYIYNNLFYVAFGGFYGSKKATVMKFDGSSWANVGNPDFSAGMTDYVKLFIYNGVSYVTYKDYINNNKATVMEFDGSSWVTVGNSGFSAGQATFTSLFVYNGVPYVAYQDYANNQKATVMKFNGTTWENVGNAGFSASFPVYISLFVYKGVPYVAYKDGGNSSKATVMKFDGSSWITIGSAGFSAGEVNYTSLYIYKDVIYVAFEDSGNSNKATVMKFDGSSWVPVGNAGFSIGPAAYTSLFVYNDVLYLAYQDGGDGGKATVMKFDGSSWVAVGNTGFSAGQASYTSLFIYNGVPYVAYRDDGNGGKATVMKFGP